MFPHYREFIYVVEFSSGVVKVGKTVSQIEGRIRAHQRDAERFNLTLKHWFTEVNRGRACELRLIQAAHDLGGEVTRGIEYFRNVDYDDVISAAERIALEELALTEA